MKKDLISKYEIETNQYLVSCIKCGIMSSDEVWDIQLKTIKNAVLEVHAHSISQGSGKDRRWHTRVRDPINNERKKIAAQTEDELYCKLYEFYFGEDNKIKIASLKTFYPIWREKKLNEVNRASTVRRIDLDFIKYYLNAPESQTILNKPLINITRSDIKEWSCVMIKTYNMTYKRYSGMKQIIKQILEYYVDKGYIGVSPCTGITIDKKLYKRVQKADAETQIFYPEEKAQIINRSIELAFEKNDEVFLAIPIAYFTGCRPGEVMALSFSDFDRNTNKVFVHRSLVSVDKMEKNLSWGKRSYRIEDYLKLEAEPSYIDIPDACLEMVDKIRDILNRKKIERDFLFDVKTPSNFEDKMYKVCKDLGIYERSPHKLRKTYISDMLNNGIDADYIRTQARHKDLATTLKYYTYSTTKRNENLVRIEKVLRLEPLGTTPQHNNM